MSEADARFKQSVRELSDRLVEAQRPIRILDAIKWDDKVASDFLAAGGKELPKVDRSYYDHRPLPFDAPAKRLELQELSRDITRTLGEFSPVAGILRRMCAEYVSVIRMLEARGTPEFGLISQQLYGGATDAFHAGDPSLADLGVMLSDTLERIDGSGHIEDDAKDIPAEKAVEILQERLDKVFGASERRIRVMLSDGIVADAAAGADYLKLRAEASFSARDLRLLEIHEGWVHVGTTLNGAAQPICTFLSKGPPSATVTQEGLAILAEILAFASHPPRLRRLTNRIRGVGMAEQGADFCEVYAFFAEQGFAPEEAYQMTARVFRGSTPTGLPFTKDLSYSKGFVLTYNFILLAVKAGKLDIIPLLFVGKTNLADMRLIRQLVEEGLVARPAFVPEPFADLKALSAWMCYSSFLSRLSLGRMEADYASLL